MNSRSQNKRQVQFPSWLLVFLWLVTPAAAGCSSEATRRRSDGPSYRAERISAQAKVTDANFGLTEPSSSEPVTATMRANPSTVRAGETFEILVRARIAGSYYLYASNHLDEPFAPVALNLTLPHGVEALGDWKAPAPSRTKSGELIYTDSVLFRRPLKVSSNAPVGVMAIAGELHYQACTEELCWPPRTIKLSASATVSSHHPLKP
jgi:thiol:disulfide interchange protein